MIFLFFSIVTSNYKNSMYPRSVLCEEAKIKQRTPLKKELCEIVNFVKLCVWKQYGNPDSHRFLFKKSWLKLTKFCFLIKEAS